MYQYFLGFFDIIDVCLLSIFFNYLEVISKTEAVQYPICQAFSFKILIIIFSSLKKN